MASARIGVASGTALVVHRHVVYIGMARGAKIISGKMAWRNKHRNQNVSSVYLLDGAGGEI